MNIRYNVNVHRISYNTSMRYNVEAIIIEARVNTEFIIIGIFMNIRCTQDSETDSHRQSFDGNNGPPSNIIEKADKKIQ